eukprot:5773921-Amphidinium_carterae.1
MVGIWGLGQSCLHDRCVETEMRLRAASSPQHRALGTPLGSVRQVLSSQDSKDILPSQRLERRLRHLAVSSREHEIIRRDLARRLDACPVSHPRAVSWHPLSAAVQQLHPGAIVRQAEPPAALGEDLLYDIMALCCQH